MDHEKMSELEFDETASIVENKEKFDSFDNIGSSMKHNSSNLNDSYKNNAQTKIAYKNEKNMKQNSDIYNNDSYKDKQSMYESFFPKKYESRSAFEDLRELTESYSLTIPTSNNVTPYTSEARNYKDADHLSSLRNNSNGNDVTEDNIIHAASNERTLRENYSQQQVIKNEDKVSQENMDDQEFEKYLLKQEEMMQHLKETTEMQKLEKPIQSESQYSTTPLNKFNDRIIEFDVVRNKIINNKKNRRYQCVLY